MKCDCGCGRDTQAIERKLRPAKSEIFWVERDCGYVSSCWVWQRALNWYGYAHTNYRGLYHLIHRLHYSWYVSPIPEGLVIDHLCRNRACVRPDHLEPVTNAVNIQRGNTAILNPEIVKFARWSYYEDNWSITNIASALGVPRQTLKAAIDYESWKEVT